MPKYLVHIEQMVSEFKTVMLEAATIQEAQETASRQLLDADEGFRNPMVHERFVQCIEEYK